tara:strand:- start:2039 stop:2209 length:171 start_codon:yes stop_codon:yes gene_type:complete
MFSLAKELKMTVKRLADELTMEELLGWSAYFSIVDKERKQEEEKAQRTNALRGRTR